MASEHTPGPWLIEWPDEDEQWARYHDGSEFHDPNAYLSRPGGGWQKFAAVVVLFAGEPDEAGKANAHLIAAAPDLLAACEAVVVMYDSFAPVRQQSCAARGVPVPPDPDWVVACRAAVARARGR